MPSKYLSTRLATDWKPGKDLSHRIIEAILFFVPRANPGYEKRLHLIDRWLVEFDETGQPWREVGLTKDDEIAVAGPSERDYGFWCDTNMMLKDFDGEEISEDEFEQYWQQSISFREGEE